MTEFIDERHPHAQDTAPGEQRLDGSGIAQGILSYLVGLGFAGGLTIASFYFAGSSFVWQPAIPVALIVLAIAQMGVHLAFFLHITTGPESTNNVLALAFGVLIVFLVIAGSIWIMGHLDHNMMAMPPMDMMGR